MSFCPKCRFEYKEGVKECPDCGAALVGELSEQNPSAAPNFVPLKNLPSRLYAQMLQEAL